MRLCVDLHLLPECLWSFSLRLVVLSSVTLNEVGLLPRTWSLWDQPDEAEDAEPDYEGKLLFSYSDTTCCVFM